MFKRTAAAILILMIGLVLSLVMASSVEAQNFGSNWFGQYYANATFSGAPVFTRTDQAVNFTFGQGSPGPGVPVDNFSVRWQSTQTLEAGTYTFTVTADDDASVILNGVTIIPFTGNTQGVQTRQIQQFVNGGTTTIEVRYVEYTGNASISFFWQGSGTTVGTAQPTATRTVTPLPPIPPGALTATVIRASVLNVRDAPSLGGQRLGTILRGQTYQIIGRDENARWFLLQLSGYQGWAWGYYLFVNGNEFNAPVRSPFGTIGVPPGVTDTGTVAQTQSSMRLRAEPSVASAQIGRITWGAFLPVIGRTSDGFWWQVVWKGTVGWVYSPFSEIIQGDLNAVPVVR